jgi:hypothetical protein
VFLSVWRFPRPEEQLGGLSGERIRARDVFLEAQFPSAAPLKACFCLGRNLQELGGVINSLLA